MLLTLVWIFLYPAIGIAANIWHTSQWQERLADIPGATGGMVVFPDAFAPFFWRVLYEQDTSAGVMVSEQSVNALGTPRAKVIMTPAAPAALVAKIADDSLAGGTYFDFAVLPVMRPLRPGDEPVPPVPDSRLLMFYDLRFGSGLEFVRELLAMRRNADMPFQLLAELIPSGPEPEPLAAMDVGRIRLRFSDSGRDSQWHRPKPASRPDIWQWLVGLE